MLTRDPLSVSLGYFAVAHALAVGALALLPELGEAKRRLRPVFLIVLYGVAAGLCVPLAGQGTVVLIPLAVGLGSALAGGRVLRSFTAAGATLLLTFIQLALVALPWSVRFVATLPVGPVTRGLMLAGFPLLLLAAPAALLQTFEGWEVLCRARWRRPRDPLPEGPRTHYPKVSFHVPIHAEPPEVVIETLDALARLRYPNFEVLVIDNNTEDPELWRPVEAHCRRLGEAFRFFHVEGLPGAKAGALNFALRHTAPAAELVGVIDADYVVDVDFCERLVGYFEDPRMGFVQTPHDYRGWERSAYLRMCYWEYRYFYRTVLVSRNERCAALTVGTMCLIRRSALESAGGWAEWCVTEDSELAIRIHALGYSSVYLSATFGRGLIPETFLGYKRQRFRWTYGPVQELKHHYRLMLPRPFGRRSALTSWQKLHHFNHGFDRLGVGVQLLMVPLALGVAASMAVGREAIPVPFELWLAVTLLLVAGMAMRWLLYRRAIGCSSRDALRAAVASKSLAHTVSIGGLAAMFTRTIPWRRTDKFKSGPSLRRALSSVRAELALSLFLILFSGAVFGLLPRPGLLLMLLIGVILQSLRYAASVGMALLAEWELWRRSRRPALPSMDRWAWAASASRPLQGSGTRRG